MLSDRTIGIGFVIVGLVSALPGIAELMTGQLIYAGGGKQPWVRGFFQFFFGPYAHLASGYVTLCIASALIVQGARLILRKPRITAKEAE